MILAGTLSFISDAAQLSSPDEVLAFRYLRAVRKAACHCSRTTGPLMLIVMGSVCHCLYVRHTTLWLADGDHSWHKSGRHPND